jgi:hypothetical protein
MLAAINSFIDLAYLSRLDLSSFRVSRRDLSNRYHSVTSLDDLNTYR